MIQYYLDLENQVKILEDKNLSGGQIQKIYSTAFYISMAIRSPGKTWHLYFGRGGGYEGIWVHDSPPPSKIRRKDNFLEYLRRHLSSCAFLKATLDGSDRILRLDYQKYGKIESFLLFWKARKLYFIHCFQDQPEAPFKLLLSWHGKTLTLQEEPDDLFQYFTEVGRRDEMNHDLMSPTLASMDILLQEELKLASVKGLLQPPSFLQRKQENIASDLRRAEQWERLQSLLDKGAPLDGHEIKIGDHKIKFVGDLNPYERRNLVFQKIKKLKRGEIILKDRLEKVKDQIGGKEEQATAPSKIPIIKPQWGKEELPRQTVSRNVEEEYLLLKGENYHFGVGKNAQGNDQLRNKWANKEDYWFHLDGNKSAHVILKLLNKATLEPEVINEAAAILAHFSHFTGEWIPVVYTQVKNLKGVTGAPGMVIYKKEKRLNCPKVDIDQWLKELR